MTLPDNTDLDQGPTKSPTYNPTELRAEIERILALDIRELDGFDMRTTVSVQSNGESVGFSYMAPFMFTSDKGERFYKSKIVRKWISALLPEKELDQREMEEIMERIGLTRNLQIECDTEEKIYRGSEGVGPAIKVEFFGEGAMGRYVDSEHILDDKGNLMLYYSLVVNRWVWTAACQIPLDEDKINEAITKIK